MDSFISSYIIQKSATSDIYRRLVNRTNEDSLPAAASLASSSVSSSSGTTSRRAASSSFPPATNYTTIPSSSVAPRPPRYHEDDHFHVRSDNNMMIRRGGISSLGTNHSPSCTVAPAPAPAPAQSTTSSTTFRSIPTYCFPAAAVSSQFAPRPINHVIPYPPQDDKTSNTCSTTSTNFSFSGKNYHNQQQEDKKTHFSPEKKSSPGEKRSTTFKIELCKSFPNSFECKFGDSCSFAHSYDELQLQTFRERAEKGLIHMDFIETYRSRPCFDFVATGSCPFESRCGGLHDPRIIGNVKWWLRHLSKKCSSTAFDIVAKNEDVYVDYYNFASFSPIHYGHAFGFNFLKKIQKKDNNDSFEEFLETVSACIHGDGGDFSSSSTSVVYHYQNITPLQSNDQVVKLNKLKRLHIALSMRHDYETSLSRYKYSPTHIIFNELCMVVQICAFDVGIKEWDIPQKIDIASFNSKNKYHVKVIEITFGPYLSPFERPIALYFDIQDEELRVCTEQEKKRLDRTKKKLAKNMGKTTLTNQDKTHVSSFDDFTSNYHPAISNKPIIICSTFDKDCYDFVTKVLEESYSYQLRSFKVIDNYVTITRQEQHQNEKKHHRDPINITSVDCYDIVNGDDTRLRFNAISRHFAMFQCPANNGVEQIDEHTLVPMVETEYKIGDDYLTGKIWNSFVVNNVPAKMDNFRDNSINKDHNYLSKGKKMPLSVFACLRTRDNNSDESKFSMRGIQQLPKLRQSTDNDQFPFGDSQKSWDKVKLLSHLG